MLVSYSTEVTSLSFQRESETDIYKLFSSGWFATYGIQVFIFVLNLYKDFSEVCEGALVL